MREKPKAFSLAERFSVKKRKSRRSFQAIRKLLRSPEGQRECFLHSINFGIVETPTENDWIPSGAKAPAFYSLPLWHG
jgi:hypothetical protein